MSKQLTKIGLLAIVLLAALAGAATTFAIIKISTTTECPTELQSASDAFLKEFYSTPPKNTGRDKEY